MSRIAALVIWLGLVGCSHHAGMTTPDGRPPGTPDAAQPDAELDAVIDAAMPVTDRPPHLAVGKYQSCAIHGDGSLWCWGTPDLQLADSLSVPTQVGSDLTWTAISIDQTHACGIDGGALYCWGLNFDGELGTGDTDLRAAPVRIGTEDDWTSVAAGPRHTCGVRTGALYCWGANAYGEAGDPARPTVMTPTQLGTDTDWVAVAAGYEMTCGLRGPGTAHSLWCWGHESDGDLGDGMTSGFVSAPAQVGTDSDWVAITASFRRSCGRRADGTAWCWGRDFAASPSQVGTTADYTSMAPGLDLTCSAHGGTWSCRGGLDNVGAGDGAQLLRSSFIDLGAGHVWREVAASETHACASDDTGAIWCFGQNGYGALGLGTRPQRPTHERVGTAAWSSITVDARGLACGLSGDAAYCWGASGPQLGDGTGLAHQVPTLVGTGFLQVVSTLGAACGIKTDHTLWCWGTGDAFGSSADAPTPTQIGTATDWTSVALGWTTCGLRAGALYCWGNNAYGQVGDGTVQYRAMPTRIGSATDWTAIATRQGNTCGIRAGALYCWGFGPKSTSPVQVGTDTDWVTIAMDDGGKRCGLKTTHTWACGLVGSSSTTETTSTDWASVGTMCGVKTDGTLWCPGGQVGTDTDWVSYSWSYPDGCGVHTDGALTCRGDGLSGELGLGDAWALVPGPVVP